MSLLVAGDGPERGALERRAQELGLAPRVRFLGARPRDEVLELFRAADAAILSSAWENFPHTVRRGARGRDAGDRDGGGRRRRGRARRRERAARAAGRRRGARRAIRRLLERRSPPGGAGGGGRRLGGGARRAAYRAGSCRRSSGPDGEASRSSERLDEAAGHDRRADALPAAARRDAGAEVRRARRQARPPRARGCATRRSRGRRDFALQRRHRLGAVDGPLFYGSLPARVARELRRRPADAVLAQSPYEALAALAGRGSVGSDAPSWSRSTATGGPRHASTARPRGPCWHRSATGRRSSRCAAPTPSGRSRPSRRARSGCGCRARRDVHDLHGLDRLLRATRRAAAGAAGRAVRRRARALQERRRARGRVAARRAAGARGDTAARRRRAPPRRGRGASGRAARPGHVGADGWRRRPW